jgi:flavin-dependent dehydrogenase
MKVYDVVIIGAGLAGLQCARLLGAEGARVLLVDRKKDLANGVHTTGIFVRKTLEDFAFPPGTLGPAVRRVTLYSPNLKTLELESGKDEFRVGKMSVLYRSLLADCLAAGVEFSGGTRYVSALRSVVALEKEGRPFLVHTKVVIGADGARSRVARDLRLDENSEWIVGCEEVFASPNRDCEPRLHCFLDAALAPGYLAWIADDGEEVHAGVGGYAADFNPRRALSFFKQKTAHLYDFKTAKLIETRGGRIPVGGILRKIANENGLLIGDAAGAVSPLTAGGLDPALRLSQYAAEIVGERLRRDDPRILLKYSGELFRARFVSRLWMRRTIKTVANQTMLELGFALLRGKTGRRFARHVFFGRNSFPDAKIDRAADVLVPKIVK